MYAADNVFEFGAWPTPFEGDHISILEIAFSRSAYWDESDRLHLLRHSLLGTSGSDLTIRLFTHGSRLIYRIGFETVEAYRLLDENGLSEYWNQTTERSRPGRSTFRVRNGAWSRESSLSFLLTDGWSFVVASDDDCVEIVSLSTPEVSLETDGPTH